MGEGGSADVDGFNFSSEVMIMVKEIDFVAFGKFFGALAFDVADADKINLLGQLFAINF